MKKSIKVLLIEDRPEDRKLIGDMLSGPTGRPFEVIVAETLGKGLKKIQEGRADVILLSLDLPDRGGLSALDRVIGLSDHLPVIVCSAAGNEDSAVRAIRAGAQDYVTKGKIDPDILTRAVRYAIERKRIEVSLRDAHGTLEGHERQMTSDLEAANKRLIGEIAERSKIEKALMESEGKWRSLFETSTDGVFIIDATGKITYFNAAAEKILGIPRKNALRRPYAEIIYGSGRKTSSLIQSCDTGLELLDQEDEFIARNRTPVSVSLSVSQLSDPSGKGIGSLVTFRDLTAIAQLKKEIDEKYSYLDIVSKNRKMREIFDILPAVAESESTVLIEGKSGTGKELFARAIHNLSSRKNGPFVAVNCAAIPESLIESELFGYVKGAFTDAVRDKIGRFAAAGGGTILLDEIGELAKPLQVKLVRVLEQRQYEPLGSSVSNTLDARIICSTNRDLGMEVGLENFREDLYYRIHVIKIALPELSERREDIPLLATHFVKKLSLRMGKPLQTISDEVMDALIRYDFPGNVRQLENIIERMLVVSSGGTIGTRHLPGELIQKEVDDNEYSSFKDEIEGSEKKMIQEVLIRYKGNRGLAARALNMNRTTLWRKMQKHNLIKNKQ